MSSPSADAGHSRLLTTVWIYTVVALAAAARLLWWYWPGSIFDGVTSHIWTALAWDFAHGEFYRSPLGPNGYGGTRYMPLLFVAHGLLIRAHVDAIRAGVMLMQGSVIAAAAALFVALRSLNVSARLALGLACTVCGTVIYQQYCTDLDPDYAAAALGVSAIAFTVGSDGHNGVNGLAVACMVVVLAALTKVTAIAYVAPIAAWLAVRGRIQAAVSVALGTAALLAVAVVSIEIASHGQFGEGFRATVSGGMGMSDVWRAVPKFAREIVLDPFVGAPFAMACWCVVAAARRRRLTIADATLVTTAAVTLIIFASPGTVGNHLVDLHIASVMVIGVALAQGTLSPRPAVVLFAALAVALAAISIPIPRIPSVIATLRAQGPPSRAVVRAIHDEFLPPGTHYLSTDPVIEVLNDQRPLVLDAFNLNRFFREGAPAGRDVERRIRHHDFQVIVVRSDRSDARERNDLERLIYENYDERAVRPPFTILAAPQGLHR